MRGYPAKVSCVDWHPRKPIVATAGGRDLVLWKIAAQGAARPQPLRLHRAPVTALAYAPGGDSLLSAARDGQVCLWSHRGQPLQTLELDAEVTCTAWSPDGTALALGCTDGRIRVQDIAPTVA
jgi:WD40 repeat protein